MIRREFTPDLINRISNKQGIKPIVTRGGEQEVDWWPAVRSCVILSNGEDACMVFEQTADRDWQVMTLYDETCRGKRALETGLAMKEWMKPHADMIFGSIPDSLPHAQWFYRKMGGVKADVVESGGYLYTAQEGETLLVMRMET